MATGVVATAPAASADTAGRVTKSEFRKISKGDSIKRVHRIFDAVGKQSFVGYGSQSREYKPCGSRYGFVDVSYDRRAGAWWVERQVRLLGMMATRLA